MLGSIEQWAPDVPVYAVLDRFARHTPPVADGDRIVFGDDPTDVLEVVATPGHTSDSISLIHDGVLFSGDTILGEGTTIVTYRRGRSGTTWPASTGCGSSVTRVRSPGSNRPTGRRSSHPPR